MNSRHTKTPLLLEHKAAVEWEETLALDNRPPRFYSPEEDVVRMVALEAARRTIGFQVQSRWEPSRWSRLCFQARALLATGL
jgi:hypothetical protein